jgi:hypothetical protein
MRSIYNTLMRLLGGLRALVHLGTVTMETTYEAVCRDAAGNLKWIAHEHNLVTTAGLNALLTACFKTIPGSVTWYLGLKSTGTPVAGDTMGSHASWTELTAYSEAARPTWTPGTVSAGSVSNSASKARFTANGSMTVLGLFMTDSATKGGTTGTLYGAGDFTEGSRAMVSSDTLDVTATVSATAS